MTAILLTPQLIIAIVIVGMNRPSLEKGTLRLPRDIFIQVYFSVMTYHSETGWLPSQFPNGIRETCVPIIWMCFCSFLPRVRR